MTETKKDISLNKVLVAIIGILIIIILLLLGWRITELNIGIVKMAPPSTSTESISTSTAFSTKTDVPTNPYTPVPTLAPTPGTNTFTASGTTDWFLTFEYSFPAGFWRTGTHKYTLTGSCPNEATGSATHDFTVSDSFALLPDNVYLRWGGLKQSKLYGVDPTLLEGINPLQPTTAVVTWDLITKNEAEWRSTNCTEAVSWDDGSPKPLVAQTPFQH